ncbi:hypothetical protein B0H11DRAFT_2217538 [Mycena galericulata]|nr:hypothetical protein B0H11DRAFT_2217538 [Mycena galericulata]
MEKLKQVASDDDPKVLYSKIKKSLQEQCFPSPSSSPLIYGFTGSSLRHAPEHEAARRPPSECTSSVVCTASVDKQEHDPAYAGPWMLVRHSLDRWA